MVSMYCSKCGKKKKDCNCSNKEKKTPVSAIISVILLTLIILGGCFLLVYFKDNEILSDVFEKEENVESKEKGNSNKTNQKNKQDKTDKVENEDKKDKDDEVTEEQTKYVTSVKEYVSTVDGSTNFILYPDGTVKGKRNFCEGFVDYTGTYELDGDKVTLFITEPWSGETIKEVFKIGSDDVATHYSGDDYLPICCGPDFKLKK